MPKATKATIKGKAAIKAKGRKRLTTILSNSILKATKTIIKYKTSILKR